jgi:hypothetical protein
MRESSQQSVDRIKRGWIAKKSELFSKDGSGGKNGDYDFSGNSVLQRTIDGIMEDYIPLCARKLELRELMKEQKINGEIKAEIEELDRELVKKNALAIVKIQSDGSGFEREKERHICDPLLAKGILGKTIKEFVHGVNSSLVVANDSFIPPRFR